MTNSNMTILADIGAIILLTIALCCPHTQREEDAYWLLLAIVLVCLGCDLWVTLAP